MRRFSYRSRPDFLGGLLLDLKKFISQTQYIYPHYVRTPSHSLHTSRILSNSFESLPCGLVLRSKLRKGSDCTVQVPLLEICFYLSVESHFPSRFFVTFEANLSLRPIVDQKFKVMKKVHALDVAVTKVSEHTYFFETIFEIIFADLAAPGKTTLSVFYPISPRHIVSLL